MADQIEIQIPKTIVPEGTNFTATAYFRTRSTKAAATPTTVDYRVDDLTTDTVIKDWTTATPGTSVALTMDYAINKIQGSSVTYVGYPKYQRRQLTVRADSGLSTQAIGTVSWRVKNVRGVT